MPPKQKAKAAPPPKKAPPPPPPSKKAAPGPSAAAGKRKASKVEDEEPVVEETPTPEKRTKRKGEAGSPAEESPSTAAVRAMTVVASKSVGSSPTAQSLQQELAVKSSAGRLNVMFQPSEGNGPVALAEGLVRLRRSSQFCDVTVISNFGRIPAHRTVLAAHSDTLANRLQAATGQPAELDLQPASHEAVDLVVRWLYGEVTDQTFLPTTEKVNEEVLKISAQLGLPLLSELCALRLSDAADTSNVVTSIRLCEEFGLPRLRAALVAAVVEDPLAIDAVAKDVNTLSHPALMRELLASIAARASAGDDDDGADEVEVASTKTSGKRPKK